MTKNGIRKPSWFAYKYLNALKGMEIPTTDAQVWAACDHGSVSAVVWDYQLPDMKGRSNRTVFSQLLPNAKSASVSLKFVGLKPGRYRLEVRRTGYRVNDAHSAWIAMGSPEELSADQLSQLQELTRDKPEAGRVIEVSATGTADLNLPMNSNDVALVRLIPFAPGV